MKFFQRLTSFLLCAILSLSFFITASAADIPTISVANTEAVPGDSVRINISISDNPGIMAMAFCITYDNTALVYKSYTKGYLSNYNVYPHEDEGHISFVNVEDRNINKNGNILSIIFDVKSDAKPGKYAITLENSNREKYGTKLHNSFSNSNQEFIIPKVISGGITIQETCENSGHKYGDWNITKEASCTDNGLKKHFCIRCNTMEEETIPATHDFEQVWTIDKEATPLEDGVMSRHCTKCDEVTDKITFSYKEIEDTNGSDNTSDPNTSSNTSSESTDTTSPGEGVDNKKPNINNTIGEKIPLQEAEKFENYQQNPEPDKDNDNTQGDTPSDNISSETVSDNSDKNVGNSSSSNSKISSFFTTPSGIAMLVICSILSIGIIAIGLLLVIRNKKQ